MGFICAPGNFHVRTLAVTAATTTEVRSIRSSVSCSPWVLVHVLRSSFAFDFFFLVVMFGVACASCGFREGIYMSVRLIAHLAGC